MCPPALASLKAYVEITLISDDRDLRQMCREALCRDAQCGDALFESPDSSAPPSSWTLSAVSAYPDTAHPDTAYPDRPQPDLCIWDFNANTSLSACLDLSPLKHLFL